MSVISGQDALLEAIAAQILGKDKGLHLMPFYISGYLDSLLMGVVICQMATYWHFVRRDRKHIVGLTLLAVLATTAASVLIIIWMAHLFVWGFGIYLPFTESVWLVRYMSLEIATILLVQMVYIDRACRLYAHWWPALLITPVTLGTAAIGSISLNYFVVNFKHITTDTVSSPTISKLVYTWLSLIILTDFVIMTIIVYGLQRVKAGFAHTQAESRFRRVITRCFESQTPAFINAVICIIAWNRQFEVALAFVVLQTKIYSIGLLITLNLRIHAPVSSTANDTHRSDPQGGISHSGPHRSRSSPSPEPDFHLQHVQYTPPSPTDDQHTSIYMQDRQQQLGVKVARSPTGWDSADGYSEEKDDRSTMGLTRDKF
ncbi:uncharacterized protein MKK02DRAFT_39322 [Dioszegia hungarica]|uniref:DUF6534 domain-containing protein n=1 Tax=Dioszegia hungarica TaxID=4972 RepID=A0AA38H5Y0_9TREE|nr:uncharacterized protein MKK02DRAFT_39322 [Dioszegia hungarica]KAI9633341.1 hypothetical protein MKK02DRAFT_39322 [Dioszegia hungarica]